MNIKRIIQYSFFTILIFVLLIGSISSIVLYQIKDNELSKKYIAKQVAYQEDMNILVKDLILTKDTKTLNEIKVKFIKNEKGFEKTKTLLIDPKSDEFLDAFILDLHQNKNIKKELDKLFNNEVQIEKAFDKLYTLQKEKIKLNNLFDELYTMEKQQRKEIEQKIIKIKNISITKDFGYLQYYSKETLYQHKDKKTLQQWINQIDKIYKNYDIDQLKIYKKTVQLLGSYVIQIETIRRNEQKLQNNIFRVIEKNKELNFNIENKIEQKSSHFINIVYILLFVLLFITILFIIFLGRKVSKNIGLSVDEIEAKIDEGLDEIRNLNDEITTTQKEVVFTMGAIGESRSKETGNHVKRVAEYSKIFALHYGLNADEAEMLKQASPMHDIGKVAIPDAILNKPGRFDEAERKIMDTHATLGYDMLKLSNRPLLKLAATVAYEHHEKWDGSGYPRKLKGEDIDICGRITAIADVFDALGSHRVYKKAWDDEKIFKLFKEERGKHFDPKLVDIFFDNLNDFLKIRDKFQDIEK